jgi:hypothetical protein
MSIYFKTLILIFIVVNICHSEVKPVEILSLKNDRTVYVPETGETYFSSDLELTVNDSGKYSISYNFAGNYASHSFDLSKGNQSIIFNIYSRDLLSAKVSFSSIKCRVTLFPKNSGTGITVDEKEFKLSGIYNYEHFIIKAAIIPDTFSIKDIVFSLGETLHITQHRNTDHKSNSEVRIEKISDFFPVKEDLKDTIFANYIISDGMMQHSNYISISKDRRSAFVIDSMEKFNAFVKTLDLKIDNIEDAKKQALAYLRICEYSRNDITILDEAPHYVWEWPFKKSKNLSIHKWFACNKDKAKFHKPEIFSYKDTVMIRFYTHEGFMGQLKHHTVTISRNGEIITFSINKLAFNVGKWYII